jgi:hypothetical protein
MICDCPCFFLNLNDFSIMLTAGGPPLGVCRSGQAEAVCVSECPAAEGEGRTCTLQEQRVRQGCHPWTRAWASAPLHPRLWASCPKTPVQPSAGCIPPAPCRAGPALKEPCSLRTQRQSFRAPTPSTTRSDASAQTAFLRARIRNFASHQSRNCAHVVRSTAVRQTQNCNRRLQVGAWRNTI